VACQIEVRVFVQHVQVTPRYEARVAHVNVHLALGAIPTDDDTLLSDQVLELTALELGDHARHVLVRGPLHIGRATGHGLERVQRPIRVGHGAHVAPCLLMLMRRTDSGRARVYVYTTALRRAAAISRRMIETITRATTTKTISRYGGSCRCCGSVVVVRPGRV